MRKAGLVISILIVALGAVWFFYARAIEKPTIEGPALSVRFLDDDWGNAVLVRTPEGQVAVIDPAPRQTADLADLLRSEQVREVTVVLTDPSRDEADAVAKLQRSVKIGRVIRTQQGRTPRQWNSIFIRAKCHPVAEALVEPGGTVKLSSSVQLQVLSPTGTTKTTDGSSVMRLVYRGKSLIYLSELHVDGEAELIACGANIQSNVLAVGKRESRDNPSLELLSRVRPEICVLCAHRPRSSVINRLRPKNSGATLFRTGKDGIIEIVTDGRSVQVMTGGAP